MRTLRNRIAVLPVLLIGAVAGSCASGPTPARTQPARRVLAGSERPIPLILAADQGERRVRRTLGGARLLVKVDPQTAQSPEFVMTMESIPPGEAIPAHVHPAADEIVFIHRGTGSAQLGDRSSTPVSEGATIYVPRSTRVALRNTGSQPLVIVAIFSQTGFESYLRDTSVPVGQPAVPLSAAELKAIRARHEHDIVFENP